MVEVLYLWLFVLPAAPIVMYRGPKNPTNRKRKFMKKPQLRKLRCLNSAACGLDSEEFTICGFLKTNSFYPDPISYANLGID